MKIRSSHVTNSSSSSYIIVTTKENHEKALATLEKWERKIFDEYLVQARKRIGNENIILSSYSSREDWDYDWVEWPKDINDDDKDISSIWSRYEEEARKDKLDTIYYLESD